MKNQSRIYVAGQHGLVGSAIGRELKSRGFENLTHAWTHAQLDLTDQLQVKAFFRRFKPSYVFLAAAKVGGIQANSASPATFIYDNLQIQTNVIEAARQFGVKKLLFLGSSCVYPKHAPQPMREEYLLSSALEPTNEWYAVAKIAGLKMIQAYRRQYGCDFISVMPTNLYGAGDNFDLQSSHVLPAMIRRFHEAKVADAPQVTLWGTGKPRREFLHVDDLAAACLLLMRDYSSEQIINVGAGTDISIAELADLIKSIVGYTGEIKWDTSKPDGTPRKLLDISRISDLGWKPKIDLETGIKQTYEAYLKAL